MPTRAEIATAFADAAIEVLGELPPDINESSAIAADVGADSLDLLEIVLVLEERFDMVVAEDDFEEVVTVGDALDRLTLLLAAEGKA